MTPNHYSPAGNLLGVKVSPETIAQWIQRPNREFLAKLLTGLANPKYFALLNAGDGINKVTVQGEVILGPEGMTVTLDLSNLPATGGSQSATRLRVKDDLGSSLRCRTWDGTTEGSSDVFVAKQPTIRNTYASAVQNGITYTFSYTLGSADTNGNHYLVRTTSGSDSSSATSDIEPPFIFNDNIYASPIASETLDGNTCTLIDNSPRAWAARQ